AAGGLCVRAGGTGLAAHTARKRRHAFGSKALNQQAATLGSGMSELQRDLALPEVVGDDRRFREPPIE
ncbi:MAG: hypothetical protein AAF488_16205, partial [Planctomycetota bacterium]